MARASVSVMCSCEGDGASRTAKGGRAGTIPYRATLSTAPSHGDAENARAREARAPTRLVTMWMCVRYHMRTSQSCCGLANGTELSGARGSSASQIV